MNSIAASLRTATALLALVASTERVVAIDVPEKADYTGRRSTALYLYVVPVRKP